MIFEELEPQEIPYLGSAIVASTVANFAGKSIKKSSTPKDFMPRFERQEPEQPQTDEEIANMAGMLNAMFGGEDKRE